MATAETQATAVIRRADARYTAANQRTDNCKGCKFMDYEVRDPDTAYERKSMHCKLGNFAVSHGSICDAWAKAS